MNRSGKPDPECPKCDGSGSIERLETRSPDEPGPLPDYAYWQMVKTRCPCTDTHHKIDTLTVQEETHPLGQRGVPEFHTVTRVDSAEDER